MLAPRIWVGHESVVPIATRVEQGPVFLEEAEQRRRPRSPVHPPHQRGLLAVLLGFDLKQNKIIIKQQQPPHKRKKRMGGAIERTKKSRRWPTSHATPQRQCQKGCALALWFAVLCCALCMPYRSSRKGVCLFLRRLRESQRSAKKAAHLLAKKR